MLMLSITILAVTGTVVNIVSAAHGINVQPKTNQHHVTSIGSPHIVPSSYKPIIVYVCPAGGSVKVPPKYRMVCSHTVSSAVNHPLLAQCFQVDVVDGDGALPQPSPRDRDCPADIRDMHLNPQPPSSAFTVDGKLIGCEGQMDTNPFSGGCYGWVNVDNAPIEIKVMMGKDKHGWYTPAVVTKTGADATFRYTFSLCDNPKYSDHSAYLTAYFPGGKVSGQHPGPYAEGTSSAGRGDMWFTLKTCQTPNQKSQ
jgi:hypothetical protein